MDTLTLPTHLRQTPAAAQESRPSPLAGRRIHFMGAGGIGVSAMMELAASRGALVSGCDLAMGGPLARLQEQGIPVCVGHDPAHIRDCDELVYTAAIAEGHPEIEAARRMGKEITPRMRMLGKLARATRAICVTGSHGKTTTTWMIAHILIQAGLDPAVLVGGIVPALGGNARISQTTPLSGPPWFVMETDESDHKLDEVRPTLAVITNIDNDHLDHYDSLEAIQEAMAGFCRSIGQVQDHYRAAIGCGDDLRVLEVLRQTAREGELPALSYGLCDHNMFQATEWRVEAGGNRFSLRGPFGLWPGLFVPLPGVHNLLNALAASAVAWRLGIPEKTIRQALENCQRVKRRFEVKGIQAGVQVVDDYGHHPTEIAMTLRAAKAATQGRIGVLFQPHRFSRTALLMETFAKVLADANPAALFLLPIYPAGEKPIEGVSHEALAARIRQLGHPLVRAMRGRAEAVRALAAWARSGDLLLTQGAGDVTRAGPELLQVLQKPD